MPFSERLAQAPDPLNDNGRDNLSGVDNTRERFTMGTIPTIRNLFNAYNNILDNSSREACCRVPRDRSVACSQGSEDGTHKGGGAVRGRAQPA